MVKLSLAACLTLLTAAPLFAAPNLKPGGRMEKVLGLGGLFFRAQDPDALGKWYRDNLGIDMVPDNYDKSPWKQAAGPTVFAPFSMKSEYFGDPKKVWMMNFRVKDIDAMAAQLRAAGITVKIDPETYPNGRFARLQDPEGNPIELWEPKVPKPKKKRATAAR